MCEEEFDKKNRQRLRVDMSEVDFTYVVTSLPPTYFLLKSSSFKAAMSLIMHQRNPVCIFSLSACFIKFFRAHSQISDCLDQVVTMLHVWTLLEEST